MPEALRPLAGWLLTYLIHSGALVVGAWLLARLGLVRRARTLDLMWKAALVAGFATATLAVARAPRPSLDPRAALRDAMTWTGEAPHGRKVTVHMRTPGPAASWPSWLAALWLAGAGVGALTALRTRAAARRILAGGRPAPARTHAALARVAGRAGVGAPLALSDEVGSPCVLGGTIVLPPRCALELTEPELEAVFAHELAHVARRDGLWAGLADVVCRLAWVQPLNRVAAAGLREAAEAVCDGWAVRHARPTDLARSIHRVAEWAVPERGPAHASALARGDGRTLSARIRRILSAPGPDGGTSSWRGAVLVAALVVGTVSLPPVRLARQVTAIFIERTEGAGGGPPAGRDVRAVRVFIRGSIPGDGSPFLVRSRTPSPDRP